eukprot:10124039-Alexandrium_andersonii.AAC.1
MAAEAYLQRDLSQLRGDLAGLRARYLAAAQEPPPAAHIAPSRRFASILDDSLPEDANIHNKP